MSDDPKTRQEIIEYVYLKLKAQGKRSHKSYDRVSAGGDVTDYGMCQYRQGDCRCAVGWIIPDEHYKPWFEGLASFSICEELKNDVPIFSDYQFMEDLQGAHDRCDDDHFFSSLRENFYHLAQIYNLDLNFLE